MKNQIIFLFASFLSIGLFAQTPVFDEEITIPDSWELDSVLLPPSPLTTQVLFVGGHDIVQTTRTYDNPAGRQIAKEWHDFIGWTPDTTGQTMGWASVNHECVYVDDKIGDGGGMTVFRLQENSEGGVEVVEQTLEDGRQGHFFNVDFVNTVGETGMNCAGISAPDGRIWTAEEWFRENNASIWQGQNLDRSSLPKSVAGVENAYGVRDTSDFTINAPEFPLVDGMTISKHNNFNFMVEIDPRQAKAIRKQYNWGRAGWEGGAITEDMKTVYLGDDSSPAPWLKFEANTAGDFTDGTLYFYKHTNAAGERWVAIPMDNEDIIFGGLRSYCFENGATMFMRNEWVAIDHETGKVYWSETGRDNAGERFAGIQSQFPDAHVHPALDEYAQRTQGLNSATDENYADYYGRIWYYDPATNDMGIAIHGGPYFDADVALADYPEKHLSNPDGLKIMNIDGEQFLLICEDLNGRSNGRVPEGVSNSVCELWLLPIAAVEDSATYDDLVRITAIPAGAEVTGAIQISDNTILMNSQHPTVDNPFPYNHSLTMAINGFSEITVSALNPEVPSTEELTIYPNPTTRALYLSEPMDFAIYDMNGKRLKVFRNKQQIDVSNLAAGNYILQTAQGKAYKFIVQ